MCLLDAGEQLIAWTIHKTQRVARAITSSAETTCAPAFV